MSLTITNNDIITSSLNTLHLEEEKSNYVNQTMLTCIGNKRKIVKSIRTIVDELRILLKKDRLNIVDGFAGSCVVSRELTYVSANLYTNDMEYYSYLMSYSYLIKPNDNQKEKIIITGTLRFFESKYEN